MLNNSYKFFARQIDTSNVYNPKPKTPIERLGADIDDMYHERHRNQRRRLTRRNINSRRRSR